MTSRKALVAIGVVVFLLMVVAVVFAVVPPPQLDPGTPEGATQGYFQAIDDDDLDLARTYLAEELARCEFDPWRAATSKVVIRDVSEKGDRAVVTVKIEVSYGDSPFDGGSYDFEESVVMEHFDSGWLIVEPLWPMDIYGCRENAP